MKENKIKTSINLKLSDKEYLDELQNKHNLDSFTQVVEYVINYYKNTSEIRKAGRTPVEIPENALKDMLRAFTLKEIASEYGVSVTTIQNKMRRYGISKHSVLDEVKADVRSKGISAEPKEE